MLPHRGEPINEQEAANTSGQTSGALTSKTKFFIAIVQWTPEGGPGTLACGPITGPEACGIALEINGVDRDAFDALPGDKQAEVLAHVLTSGMVDPLYENWPKYVV